MTLYVNDDDAVTDAALFKRLASTQGPRARHGWNDAIEDPPANEAIVLLRDLLQRVAAAGDPDLLGPCWRREIGG